MALLSARARAAIAKTVKSMAQEPKQVSFASQVKLVDAIAGLVAATDAATAEAMADWTEGLSWLREALENERGAGGGGAPRASDALLQQNRIEAAIVGAARKGIKWHAVAQDPIVLTLPSYSLLARVLPVSGDGRTTAPRLKTQSVMQLGGARGGLSQKNF